MNLFVKNEADKEKALEFYHNMVDYAIEVKGTFSAEHGVGKIKREFLLKMYSSSEVEEMKVLKRKFDPKLLFGYDTLFFNGES